MNGPSKLNLKQWLQSPTGFLVVGILAFAVIYLVTEYTAQLFNLLPYVFLLLCPLLHILMMRGAHRQHTHHSKTAAERDDPKSV